jgi:hypothetical protein
MRKFCVLSAVVSLACAPVFASSLNFTGSYSNDFNLLPRENVDNPANAVVSIQTGRGPHGFDVGFLVSGFDGWFGSNPAGSSSNTEFKSHDGSLAGSAGRGVLSLGLNGDTDRALGALSTSNQINTFGLVLINGTNGTIDSLDVSYIGEQWRRGNILSSSPDVNSLRFSFATFASDPGTSVIDDLLSPPGTSPANFTTVEDLTFNTPNRQDAPLEVAINGNESANQTARSATLGSLNWQAGQYLVLRWSARDISGQDDGLAIDSLVISAGVNPPEFVVGDFNFDGGIDASDIDPFVVAANEGGPYAGFISQASAAFASLYPGQSLTPEIVDLIGDINGDGGLDSSDIDPFVPFANNGGARVTAIPEPGSAAILLVALGGGLLRRRK